MRSMGSWYRPRAVRKGPRVSEWPTFRTRELEDDCRAASMSAIRGWGLELQSECFWLTVGIYTLPEFAEL